MLYETLKAKKGIPSDSLFSFLLKENTSKNLFDIYDESLRGDNFKSLSDDLIITTNKTVTTVFNVKTKPNETYIIKFDVKDTAKPSGLKYSVYNVKNAIFGRTEDASRVKYSLGISGEWQTVELTYTAKTEWFSVQTICEFVRNIVVKKQKG